MVNVNEIDENYIIKHSHDLSSNSKIVKLVNDVSQATKVESVSSENITLAAGAAGVTGKIRLTYAPIMDSIGGSIGYYNGATESDSSLIVTSAALAVGQLPLVNGNTETEIYAALTNGTFSVDYTKGVIYYKKGTTGTTGTVNYKYTGQEIDLSASSVSIGDVTSNSQNIATEATLGTVNTNLGTIETDIEATNTILTDESQIAQAYGIYNATEPTLTDGDKAPLQVDENGNLKVTGGAGASSVSAEYISPSDFTATYTSSSTLTLSGVPISVNDSSQIAYIKQVKADNTSRTYVNGANDITLAYSAGVITIYEKGTAAASLVAGDVYEVGINGTTKAYDSSTDANKTISLVNVWNRYTDPEVLVTAQDLTDAYADFGAEIDMRGYNRLGVYIVTDVNDSETVNLQVLGKHTAAGTDEYTIEGISEKALWTTGASDAKLYYEFDVGTIPFIQLQAKAGTVGTTPGDLTIVIDKKWRD